MTDTGARILASLSAVACERRSRARVPGLDRDVAALKTYQQARFAHTHADLMAHPKFGQAARFFFDELYGPQDFTQRDAQFGRIVPALVRLFPTDIVATVESLAAVHALSERLDTQMAIHLAGRSPDRASYARAWQATGEPQTRARQLELVMSVGRALDRHTRSFMLRASLKAMRAPARAAGMADLQRFLESGFEAFGAMGDAVDFLCAIEARESALARGLFEVRTVAGATDFRPADEVLAQLP